MATKKSVSVRILDQDFLITTDATPDRVRKIADYLSKNMEQILSKSKKTTTYRAAILAALNITERYFDVMERHNEVKAKVTEKSRKILGLLEEGKST